MKHEETSLRTKMALAGALKEILEKKPLSKITVSEVAQRCGVNRKTFYYHFSDLYALLAWLLEQEAVEMVRHFNLLTELEDAVAFVLQYTEENQHLLRCTLDMAGREQLKRFFYADFTGIVNTVLDRTAEELEVFVPAQYKRFLCAFWTEALVGLLFSWLQCEPRPDMQTARASISAVIKASLPAMLSAAPEEYRKNA